MGKEEEILKLLSDIISKDGVKVSGNGIIITELNKVNEKLEKIDKKLFFLEKRQQEWFENYVKRKV